MTGVGITDNKGKEIRTSMQELMEEPDIDTYIKKNQAPFRGQQYFRSFDRGFTSVKRSPRRSFPEGPV